MISLSCPQCGKKLKVRDELAGKKVRCPQCKQALEIPCPDDAKVAPQHRPARREDAPFATTSSAAEDDHPAASGPAEIMKTGGSFEVSGEIARGGMGAIMRAIDQDIHREVAVKVLLDHADSRLKARFVEEAQITGQLEHPNIVPIHQLGVHEDGRCFFSMKMVKGRSLDQILKQGEPGASATGDEYSLGRLLNILVSICNALAYAHSRQVIHRDLKPANIMVGDFGEVYVMDWGLAKVLDKAEPSVPSTPSTYFQRKKSLADATQPRKPSDSSSGERVTTHRLIEGDLTQAGAVMGTPAYMPPEQAEGKLEDVDERSDIYSLGAILYEMMTLTPPVGRGGDVMSRVVETNMSVSILLSWMLCGLIVGLIARFLVPGTQSMGLLLTMVLGIVGAIVGGFLFSLIQGAPSEPFSLAGNAWHGWIVAILGAMFVLWAYGRLYPRKWWQ